MIKIDKQNEKRQSKGQNTLIKEKKEGEQQWAIVEEKIWTWLKEYYGFKDDYMRSRLFMEQIGQKRIVLVSDNIRDLMNASFRSTPIHININRESKYR